MRRFLMGALLAGITAVTAVPAVAASAATAPGAASTVKAARYCFTEVARIDPGSPATRVVSQTCSDRAIAGTVLPDSLAGAGGALPADETLLVTFFQDADYRGLWDTVGGHDGPCDVAGYSFSNLTLTNFNVNGISSYQLFNNCRFASYWNETGFQGDKRSGVRGNNRYVGAPWNDRVLSMRVWR